MSTYVPAWVKRDQSRFPRAGLPNGRGLDILSAFAVPTRDADSRALCALLAHLKKVDGEKESVVMIQVENEIGMLPVARDYGPAATVAFHAAVPDELVSAVAQSDHFAGTQLRTLWETHGRKTAGDWVTVFGDSDATAEAFTAYYYARYVESLVQAGKAIYPLPMYVNAALNRPLKAPGEYPSGGPLPHLLDVWKTGAPSLDLIAGQGVIVTFEPVGEGAPAAGIDSAWEGTFDRQGKWIAGRLLNGDQTHQGRHLRLAPGAFQIQRVRLYRYR